MITFYALQKNLVIELSFWALLKTLWNEKKVFSIPSLFAKNELITESETMANIFDTYFCHSMLFS